MAAISEIAFSIYTAYLPPPVINNPLIIEDYHTVRPQTNRLPPIRCDQLPILQPRTNQAGNK